MEKSKFFVSDNKLEVIDDFPTPDGPEIIIRNPPLTVIIYNIKAKNLIMKFMNFQLYGYLHMKGI